MRKEVHHLRHAAPPHSNKETRQGEMIVGQRSVSLGGICADSKFKNE